MEQTNCLLVKESLIRRVTAEIYVSTVMDQCVFTLPIKTFDDRSVDVFVQKRLGDLYLVHDAGITTSQLFAQGIHVTERKAFYFEEMARRLGAQYADGMFQVSCKRQDVDDAITRCGAVHRCGHDGCDHA